MIKLTWCLYLLTANVLLQFQHLLLKVAQFAPGWDNFCDGSDSPLYNVFCS